MPWLVFNLATGAEVRQVADGVNPNPSGNEGVVLMPASAVQVPPLSLWSAARRGFVDAPAHTMAQRARSGWEMAVLEAAFEMSALAAVAVPGLAFVPLPGLRYEIEGRFLLQAAVATTGPRPGVSWPTGLVDGAAELSAPNSATAGAFVWLRAGQAGFAASTGVPSANQSWLGRLSAVLLAGPSVAGAFQVTLASEIAASAVRMMPGSLLRWREI
jgi:hypothetical protein